MIAPPLRHGALALVLATCLFASSASAAVASSLYPEEPTATSISAAAEVAPAPAEVDVVSATSGDAAGSDPASGAHSSASTLLAFWIGGGLLTLTIGATAVGRTVYRHKSRTT